VDVGARARGRGAALVTLLWALRRPRRACARAPLLRSPCAAADAAADAHSSASSARAGAARGAARMVRGRGIFTHVSARVRVRGGGRGLPARWAPCGSVGRCERLSGAVAVAAAAAARDAELPPRRAADATRGRRHVGHGRRGDRWARPRAARTHPRGLSRRPQPVGRPRSAPRAPRAELTSELERDSPYHARLEGCAR
jgi:hypothetical protein